MAGNDARMWDGQAEGLPKDRRDRKPVGEPPDHRRLGEGPHISPSPGRRGEKVGSDIEARHRKQQSAGRSAHGG